jgi:hypothetical protein
MLAPPNRVLNYQLSRTHITIHVKQWGLWRNIKQITEKVSPITATRTFFLGSHNVITVSAATARTEPSDENAAAVIGFFLQLGTIIYHNDRVDIFYHQIILHKHVHMNAFLFFYLPVFWFMWLGTRWFFSFLWWLGMGVVRFITNQLVKLNWHE